MAARQKSSAVLLLWYVSIKLNLQGSDVVRSLFFMFMVLVPDYGFMI